MDIVQLECFCGKLKGTLNVVSNKSAFHVQCMCRDCQRYATYLGNEDKILDQYGASDLFQTYPAYLKITEGIENLTCIQLKEKGLLRWHSSCCKTPVANTMTSAIAPFAGVSVKFMKFTSDEDKFRVLGPIILKSFGRSARGQKPSDAYDTYPKSFMLRFLKFFSMGFLLSKHKPSPFFSEGRALVGPKILS